MLGQQQASTVPDRLEARRGTENVTGLNITIDQADQQISNSVTVRVFGELDMHTAPSLRGALTELFDTHSGITVSLDVDALSFSDSSGLSALIAIHKLARSTGGRFLLRNPGANLRRMLAITGLDDVLVVLPSPMPPPGRDSETLKGSE